MPPDIVHAYCLGKRWNYLRSAGLPSSTEPAGMLLNSGAGSSGFWSGISRPVVFWENPHLLRMAPRLRLPPALRSALAVSRPVSSSPIVLRSFVLLRVEGWARSTRRKISFFRTPALL
jgi:hypothetical protein